MTQTERDNLLAAVLAAIADVRRDTPSNDAFGALAKTVESQGAAIEDIRKNAKGANNWSKVTTAIVSLAPILAAIARSAGWL